MQTAPTTTPAAPAINTAPPGHVFRLSYLLPSGDELTRNVMYCESIRADEGLGNAIALNAFKQDMVAHAERPLLFVMCHRLIGDVVFEMAGTTRMTQEVEQWMQWDEERATQEVDAIANQEGSEVIEEVARLFFVGSAS